MNDALEALKTAVEHMHGGTARFIASANVHEQFGGDTVWEGTVSIFALDQPIRPPCYAWSAPGSEGKVKYYAVLHTPQVDSPAKAVRASIVADHRAQK